MIHDLQKASMWKRISAALLDVIILVVLIEGLVLLMMTVFGFDDYIEKKDALEETYFAEYGIDRDMTLEEYNALSEEEKPLTPIEIQIVTIYTLLILKGYKTLNEIPYNLRKAVEEKIKMG